MSQVVAAPVRVAGGQKVVDQQGPGGDQRRVDSGLQPGRDGGDLGRARPAGHQVVADTDGGGELHGRRILGAAGADHQEVAGAEADLVVYDKDADEDEDGEDYYSVTVLGGDVEEGGDEILVAI